MLIALDEEDRKWWRGTQGEDCGERDARRGLWRKGCRERTVEKGMQGGDCGERGEGRGLWRKGWRDCIERDEGRGLWRKDEGSGL